MRGYRKVNPRVSKAEPKTVRDFGKTVESLWKIALESVKSKKRTTQLHRYRRKPQPREPLEF